MDTELAADLCDLIDASPGPFHAVAEMSRRLRAGGFSRVDEVDAWDLAPGDARFVVRDDGSLIAFRIGHRPAAEAGFRLVGAHTDSPTYRVRPHWDVRRAGYRLVGVEPYGGALHHTWFDRDLTVAGRVVAAHPGGAGTRLVRLEGAPLRIPSLAIHLDRTVRTEGFAPDPQRHLVPVDGPEDDGQRPLLARVAEAAGTDEDAIGGFDLVLVDAQPAATDGSAVRAARLDNLASCHAGLTALLSAESTDATQVLVANDHEEVGSRTAEGAAGPFLADVLGRIVSATGGQAQDLSRAIRRSLLVSADTAHAVHPNYAERHEPEHHPRLGQGPVIKTNADQAYATDAASQAGFVAACREVGVTPQHFVSRADLPCGSTIGPLTATRLGLPTVDIGTPILSMHSVREQADVRDLAPMIAVLTAHYQA